MHSVNMLLIMMVLLMALQLHLLSNDGMVVQAVEEEEDEETLIGGGSPIVAELMKKLIAAYTYTDPDDYISYFPLSPSRGICRVFDYDTLCEDDDVDEPHEFDFAISLSPLPNNIKTTYQDADSIPLFGVPFVPVYNLPSIPNDKTLVLSPEILIRIHRKCTYDGTPSSVCDPNSIKFWNDSAIVALNPEFEQELNEAGEVIPIVQKGESGSNYVVKSSLAAYSNNITDFTRQITIDESDNYGDPVSLAVKKDIKVMFSSIRSTSGAISFIPLSLALREGFKYASLKIPNSKLTKPIVANLYSTDAAIAEMGIVPILEQNELDMDLENIELAADTWGSQGRTSWPFIGYGLMIFRRVHMREGIHCGLRSKWIDFAEWLLEDEESHRIIHELGFSILGHQLSELVVDKLKEVLKCGDENLHAIDFTEEGSNEISLHAILHISSRSDSIDFAIHSFVNVFNNDNLEISESSDPVAEFKSSDRAGSITTIAALNFDETLGENYKNYVTLPFLAVGGGVIFNLCDPNLPSCIAKNVKLILTPEAVADILNGEITKWNDPKIASQLSVADAALLPNHQIKVIRPVPGWDTNFAEAIKQLTFGKKTVTYSAATITSNSELHAVALVDGTEYSFALIPAFDPTLTYASIVYTDKDNVAVSATPTKLSLDQCVIDLYDPSTKKIQLDKIKQSASSQSSPCYPIIVPVYLTTKKTFTEKECKYRGGIIAAEFLQRTFGLSQSDFFFGLERFEADEKNVTLDIDTVYDEQNNVRKSRIGLIAFSEIWNLGLLAIPRMRKDRESIRASYMVELESMNCDGESILENNQKLNEILPSLRYTAFAFSVICIGIVTFIAGWVIRYRKARIVKNNSPVFLLQILLGALLGCMSIAVFPVSDALTFDYHAYEGGVMESRYSVECNTAVLMAASGFVIMISALYIKMWRIVKIFVNPKLTKFQYTDKKLLGYQFAAILLFAIELGISFAISPLRFVRTPTSFNPIDGSIIESSGSCQSDSIAVTYLPLFATMLLVVIYGNYLAYKSRNIPNEYSEGKWMAIALLVMLQGVTFGIPIILMTENSNATVSFLAKVIILITMFCIAPSFLFVPKFLLAYGCIKSKDDALKISNSSSSKLDMQKQSKSDGSKELSKEPDKKSRESLHENISKTIKPIDVDELKRAKSKIELSANASMASLVGATKYGSKVISDSSKDEAKYAENENMYAVDMLKLGFSVVSSSISPTEKELNQSTKMSIDVNEGSQMDLTRTYNNSKNNNNIESESVAIDETRLKVAPWLDPSLSNKQ